MSIARFTTGDGKVTQGQEVIVPICARHDDGRIECIGTSVFIADCGIFATAAHVIKHYMDENGKPPVDADGNPKVGLFALQFTPPKELALRHIFTVCYHTRHDVAVGIAAPLVDPNTGAPQTNKCLPLTRAVPHLGEDIATWAYPNAVTKHQIVGTKVTGSVYIEPRLYEGKIEADHREGRGGMLPGSCYQTSLDFEAGTSGGPVFNSEGRIFAVNSTGMDGQDNLSWVSHIQTIGGLTLPNFQTPDGVIHDNITIKELIDCRVIIVDE